MRALCKRQSTNYILRQANYLALALIIVGLRRRQHQRQRRQLDNQSGLTTLRICESSVCKRYDGKSQHYF